MSGPAIEAARGTMPVLQFCTLDQLQVDPGYQRSTDTRASQALIARIARRWDWRLFQPLVVARRQDGGLYVVDGQHRLTAARMRQDITQLPCVIAHYDDPAQEAAVFVDLNRERRPLITLNIFQAALAAGDAEAVALNDVLVATGFQLTRYADAGRWKPGWINNVASLQACQRQHGARVLRLSLEAMRDGFPGEVMRHCGTMFSAIYPAVAGAGTDYVPAAMAAVLRRRTLEQWVEHFRTRAAQEGVTVVATARVLVGGEYAAATDG